MFASPRVLTAMTSWAWVSLVLAAGVAVYAYVVSPALLLALVRLRPPRESPRVRAEWPSVTITLPVHNEERTVCQTLERLLQLEYPQPLQIVVISDASNDATDELVRSYAGRGVELLRLPSRMGKTAAENAGRRHARGSVIVNTDASVRVPEAALKPLVAAFADETVGVASGRDVSVSGRGRADNVGEAGYVGYEMAVRDLETRFSGIVGTSGCFFASRAGLLDPDFPLDLSWDFAAPLMARERGFRSVSVPQAVCYVPRTASLQAEYRRKVRTISRGMRTLVYKWRLLDPTRHAVFAWTLFSHKLCRWMLPWLALPAVVAAAVLSQEYPAMWIFLILGGLFVSAFAVGWFWPPGRSVPRVVGLPAYLVAGNLAVIHATLRAMGRHGQAVWEPTRRHATQTTPGRERRRAG